MSNVNDPIEAWIGRGPPAGAPDACPDDNRLAGYAEGRLPATARPALEAHLSRCEACRGLVAALTDGLAVAADPAHADAAGEVGGLGEEGAAPRVAPGAPLPSLAAARARRVRTFALAAAVALFALGAGLAFRAWRTESPPDSFDTTSEAVAARLRAAEPALLADLIPLSAAERAGGVADTLRSGVRILEPAETVLSTQARVTWEPVAGATLYVVTISDATTGAVVATMKTPGTTVIPTGKALLSPGGAYLVEVAASGDLGSQKASRAFRVASAEVARDFVAGSAAIEARAGPRDAAAYFVASLAVRKHLLLEAERVLARAVAQAGAGPASKTSAHAATLDLRAHVRRRLSWPEAPPAR